MGKKPAAKRNVGIGKRGVGRNVDEGRFQMTLVPLGEKTPQLPVEILGVIAECLIGQLAFGTTASLNRVSHAVHEETLSILYESFFPEEYGRTAAGCVRGGDFPKGSMHTKYIFYTITHGQETPFARLDQFPNIVMTICVDVLNAMKENGVCHVRLYRPLSSTTAITIIETPFHRGDLVGSAMAHDLCVQMLHMSSMMQMTGLLGSEQPNYMMGDDIPMSKECMEQRAKPAIRPVTDIRKVILTKGAHLHHCPPVHLPEIKTNLRLHNLEIQSSGKGVLCKDILKTTFELLKLASMQVNVQNLEEAETWLLPEHGFGVARFGPSTCLLRLAYADWHVNLRMPMSVAEMFVRKLRVDVKARPKMLLNRIHLTITGEVSKDSYNNLLAELHEIYSSTVTGMHLVLPSRANPPEVVRCDVMDANKAVKWSGSIKVVPRKRGVLVELENDKGDAPSGHDGDNTSRSFGFA